MVPRLLHFSDDPGIQRFVPRATVARRPAGMEWLNGPLVWAIDEDHQYMYLFPRECPRILVWPVATTSDEDRERWLQRSSAKVVAHVEWDWLERIRTGVLYRYEFPVESFEDLGDAGMWVSRDAVAPTARERLEGLFSGLAAVGVELRVVHSLVPLAALWDQTTTHVSGIRLRNALGWPP